MSSNAFPQLNSCFVPRLSTSTLLEPATAASNHPRAPARTELLRLSWPRMPCQPSLQPRPLPSKRRSRAATPTGRGSPAKNFQHADAIAALEQVLAAQPNNERAHNRMAAICLHIGRLQEGRMAHEQAQRSNPKTRSNNLEFFYLYSGAFARSRRRQGKTGLETKDATLDLHSGITHNLR